MTEITKEEVRERLGNIDQIRDIIFGAQARDYDNRIVKIEADLALVQQDMRDRIEQMKTAISAELKLAVEALEKKIKTYNGSAQQESADLRDQVDRLNRKFTSSIQTLDEAIDSQTSVLKADLSQTRTSLQSDVSSLRDLVLEELERRFSQLHDVKVSKDDIAETLFELGMRLKGTEFIPKLREAATYGNQYDEIPLMATRKLTEDATL